jgi:hypothetical protein
MVVNINLVNKEPLSLYSTSVNCLVLWNVLIPNNLKRENSVLWLFPLMALSGLIDTGSLVLDDFEDHTASSQMQEFIHTVNFCLVSIKYCIKIHIGRTKLFSKIRLKFYWVNGSIKDLSFHSWVYTVSRK